MGYVYDAPVHYIVLSRKDNTWNLDRIAKFQAILDQIEATEGPGVLVTIGTGDKHFSTGFDLPFWDQSYDNMKQCLLQMQEVMARMLEFPMPTLCVFNGNAIAGGYIFGLCHDHRIMHETNGQIVLTETKLGLAFPYPYMRAVQSKLHPQTVYKIIFGVTIKQPEALKDKLIDETFNSREQLEAQISTFSKEYATVDRAAVQINKQSQFGPTIEVCRSFTFSPSYDSLMRNWYATALKPALKILLKPRPAPKL